MKAKLIGDFRGGHGSWKILLVGIDEDDSILKLLIIYHFMKFFTGIINSISIIGINNKDNALSVGVIMPPELSNLILTSDIPHME